MRRSTIEFPTWPRSYRAGAVRDVERFAMTSIGSSGRDVRDSTSMWQAARARFSTPTFDSGRPLARVDDLESAISDAEGQDHR